MAGDPINTAGKDQLTGRWPKPGDQMFFLNKNGYDYQRQKAAEIFQEGFSYEVENCEVGAFDHDIKFKGIDGRHNGVMFSFDDPFAVAVVDDAGSAPAEKLRPCPFCGDHPVVRRIMEEYPADGTHPAGEYEARVTIDCNTCGVSLSEEYRSEAVALWNNRGYHWREDLEHMPEAVTLLFKAHDPDEPEGVVSLGLSGDAPQRCMAWSFLPDAWEQR